MSQQKQSAAVSTCRCILIHLQQLNFVKISAKGEIVPSLYLYPFFTDTQMQFVTSTEDDIVKHLNMEKLQYDYNYITPKLKFADCMIVWTCLSLNCMYI